MSHCLSHLLLSLSHFGGAILFGLGGLGFCWFGLMLVAGELEYRREVRTGLPFARSGYACMSFIFMAQIMSFGVGLLGWCLWTDRWGLALLVVLSPFLLQALALILMGCSEARLRIRRRLDGLANHGKPDKVSPQPTLPSMDPILPPTNPPACDALVSEAERLQQGSMANETLINDTLFSAYAAAGAKRTAEIPQETMIEPHLSKAPTGRPGSMTWEEIWVFQTTPKTAVRITFTEDGKGGADYAIRMN